MAVGALITAVKFAAPNVGRMVDPSVLEHLRRAGFLRAQAVHGATGAGL